MNCPDCDVFIRGGGKCKKCGWMPRGDTSAPKATNGLRWWVSPPPYVKPSDDAICGEPLEDGSGFCLKTVREHRAEFLAFGERIARRVVKL